jgi:hypothetical protein
MAKELVPEDLRKRDAERYVAALREGIPPDASFGVLTLREREAIRRQHYNDNGQAISTGKRPS